jgi:hypothetical protein
MDKPGLVPWRSSTVHVCRPLTCRFPQMLCKKIGANRILRRSLTLQSLAINAVVVGGYPVDAPLFEILTRQPFHAFKLFGMLE